MKQLTELIQIIHDLWPIFLSIGAIIWKQIVDHFEQKVLKKEVASYRDLIIKLETKIQTIEKDFAATLKEHHSDNMKNTDEMKDAITELIKVSTRLTAQFEIFSQKK
jgi:hypothetical protein